MSAFVNVAHFGQLSGPGLSCAEASICTIGNSTQVDKVLDRESRRKFFASDETSLASKRATFLPALHFRAVFQGAEGVTYRSPVMEYEGRRGPWVNTDTAKGVVSYITCPSCQTAFAIDPQELGQDGRQVKCCECSKLWVSRAEDVQQLTRESGGSRPRTRGAAAINIFVGNLPYSATDEDLRSAFGAFGEVARASVAIDRETGRSRGFGFVEMVVREDGLKAIDALQGAEIAGRAVSVNEAKENTRSGPGPGSSGRGGPGRSFNGGGGGPRFSGGGRGRGPPRYRDSDS